MKVSKHRGTIEVTVKQIIGTMFVAIIIFTGVFYIGAYYGKKKLIDAELEAQRQDEIRALAKIKEVVNTAKNASPDHRQSNKGKTANEVKSVVNQVSKNADQGKIQDTKQVSDEQISPKSETLAKQIYYTVKVGTFGSEENARKLADSLVKLGYKPEIKPEKKVFHVTVGNFDSMDNAKQFGDKLIKKLSNIDKYIIKAYEQNE